MKAAVVLSSFVLIIACHCTTVIARRHSEPWLSALSFRCGSSKTGACIGVVLDKNWVLTSATCFGKCKTELPLQLNAYVKIPSAAQKRLASSIRLGNKVNGELVWQHPEYNPRTFANDLALVKLGCHNHTLEKLNLPSNCSTEEAQQTSSDGYIYLKNKVIKFNNAKDKAECFSRQGTNAWYYQTDTLQMVTTRSRGSSCMESSICKNAEQLKSFMQENAPKCNNVVSLPLPVEGVKSITVTVQVEQMNVTSSPTGMSVSTSAEVSEIQTTSTPVSIKSSISMQGPVSSDASTFTEASFLPLPTSTKTSASPVSTSTLISSQPTTTEAPTSTVLSAPVPTEASTSTQVSVSTSTLISPQPTTESPISTVLSTPVPTEASTSTQVSVSTSALISSQVPKMQTTTETPTSTILSTPLSTEASTSNQFSVSTSALISSQVPTMQPTTETPTVTILSTSVSTEISTLIHSTSTPDVPNMQTTTENVVPTPTSTETSQILSSTIRPSSVVTKVSTSEAITSTQLPAATPTVTPTSGCQLTIANGVARSRMIALNLMLITYKCNAGYHFNGINTQSTGGSVLYTCHNDTMAGSPPPCELIRCPELEPIANGTLVVRGSVLGATATYRCDTGFILSDGFTVRVCQENQQWSGKAGVCQRACPIPKSLVCSNGQRMVPSSLMYGQVGDSVRYRMRDGYAVIGEAPVCQSNFTWSALPKCIKLCNEGQSVDNAQILVHRNATSYTRKIECDEGYKPVGFTDQRCTVDGRWTPYFQRCAKTCGQVTLDNGEVNMFQSMNFLVAIMKCDEGFHLEPARAAASTCINGNWTPSIPHCVEDKQIQ